MTQLTPAGVDALLAKPPARPAPKVAYYEVWHRSPDTGGRWKRLCRQFTYWQAVEACKGSGDFRIKEVRYSDDAKPEPTLFDDVADEHE